jgi:hypothetical protein
MCSCMSGGYCELWGNCDTSNRGTVVICWFKSLTAGRLNGCYSRIVEIKNKKYLKLWESGSIKEGMDRWKSKRLRKVSEEMIEIEEKECKKFTEGIRRWFVDWGKWAWRGTWKLGWQIPFRWRVRRMKTVEPVEVQCLYRVEKPTKWSKSGIMIEEKLH